QGGKKSLSERLRSFGLVRCKILRVHSLGRIAENEQQPSPRNPRGDGAGGARQVGIRNARLANCSFVTDVPEQRQVPVLMQGEARSAGRRGGAVEKRLEGRTTPGKMRGQLVEDARLPQIVRREEAGLLDRAHVDLGMLAEIVIERGGARLGSTRNEEVGPDR